MKLLLIAVILSITALASGVTKPANYSGTWTLDKSQSKNLPRYYERIQSHKLFITQDEQHLKVAVEISLGQNEPDKMNFNYNLDGTETKTETSIRGPGGLMSVPTLLKAVVKDEGRLSITITRDISMPDRTFKAVTTEDWQLSADGKSLTIHKVDDTPRGKMESDMVFVKS